MPGLILPGFLRHPSGHSTHQKKHSRSQHASPDVSDGEGDHDQRLSSHHAKKMPDLADAVAKANKRLSFPFGKKEHQCSALSLECELESPPIVLHGNAEDSTGALLSGQFVVDVKEDSIDLEAFGAALNLRVTHKRPFQSHCNDCASQVTEIKRWNFLASTPLKVHRGRHLFPFSMLVDGHLPASSCSSLLTVAYELKSEARVTPECLPAQSHNTVKFARPIVVKRSIRQAELPHHSVRLFPPTNIKASAHYQTTIHPTGSNNVTLKLDGLMSLNEKTRTLDIWRLKKISWKLEEHTKTVAPACRKHQPLLAPEAESTAEASRLKGLHRQQVRLLGEKHIHDGWKSDFSGTDGTVDYEFDYTITQRRSKAGHLKYACDGKTADGTETTHTLCLELVVSKEYAPEGRPDHSAHTGTGRILRMSFNVVLTDHPGMGISWDEESPPTYQDVPPSPPSYLQPIDYEDVPITEYEDLQCLEGARINGAPPSRRPSGSA
ncbi:uncharacterized protein F5Z01DRAFT_627161 [Emericellopsis atlantica]|uniref:LDB19 N-terminal domain-containing protein n=1 Tax=Emericellopsis atlantica TaxID=2614577 RepID=A0A9P8CLY3_9HYPO|nr:uncharacterized protein F5Z01DRAFT_627161 [Emericellopsis atlantica]KAG9251505.1 hypothetical protein F5Z01DRAFT_627161 [Emericellopsis atlantica]